MTQIRTTRVLIGLGLWLAIGAASANAQTTAPLSPPGASGNAGGTTAPVPDKGISAPSSTGVIHPGNPDPGMAVTPPSVGLTPVVPPPGTAGNNPAVIPK